MLLRQGQRKLQVEGLHDDQGSAGVDAPAGQHHAVDVVEGQEDEQGVAFRHAPAGDELDVVGHQILLAQHDALGQAGCAAGIGQGHQVLGPVQRHLRRVLCGRAPNEVAEEVRVRLGVASDDDDFLEAWHFRAHRFDQRVERLLHDQHAGFGVVELVLDLAFLVGGIHRRDHAAQAGAGIEADDVFRAVGHVEGNAVALLDAEAAQGVGKAVGQPVELSVRDFLSLKDDRLFFRKALSRLPQHLAKRNFRDVDVGSKEIPKRAVWGHALSPRSLCCVWVSNYQ